LALIPEHLERYYEALSGKPLSVPARAWILRPAARDTARLRRLRAQACRLAETRPKVLAHPEVARAIEQGVIHALVTCLAARARDDGAARGHHTRMMLRFEEVLAAHPNRPLPMPELCELIGVTERTLRSCCGEFLGLSPSRYIHAKRRLTAGAEGAVRCSRGRAEFRYVQGAIRVRLEHLFQSPHYSCVAVMGAAGLTAFSAADARPALDLYRPATVFDFPSRRARARAR
jgi:hypothetical protein